MSAFGNYILDEISISISGCFDCSTVRTVLLKRGQLVGQPSVPLDTVYFPQTALISGTIEFSSGKSVGGVLIGNEGAFGAANAFGVKAPLFSSGVQRAGTCWLMPISELRRLVRADHKAAAVLFKHQHFLVAQAQQIAACAAKHDIRERLCSYLLRVRGGANEVRTTQEQLAGILGVRRTSVTMVASELQSDEIIRSHRGRIFIVDVDRLRASACECHATVEHFKKALLLSTEHVEGTVGGADANTLSLGATSYK